MSELHLNQKGFLFSELTQDFNLVYEQFRERIEDLSIAGYKKLLALHYNNKLEELEAELIKLGIRVEKL